MSGSNLAFWSAKSSVVVVSICAVCLRSTPSILSSTIFEVKVGRSEKLLRRSSRKRSWPPVMEVVKDDVIAVIFWRSKRMSIVSHLAGQPIFLAWSYGIDMKMIFEFLGAESWLIW